MADIVPFRRITGHRQKTWVPPAFLKRRGARFPIGALRSYAGLIALLIVAAVAIYAMSREAPRTPTITASAAIIDGDTLRIGDKRLRLVGMDAPEIQQTCRDASGRSYFCGHAARERLAALVSGSAVTCAAQGLDRYGRTLATCASSRSADLGETLVREGHAVSYRGGYWFAELGARFSGRGLWQGDFERPSDWRRAHHR
jgi:endonuclease YncB( thermonuclease family)